MADTPPVVAAHEVHESVTFEVAYPAHVQRGAGSREFEANRRQLIGKMRVPCFNPNCRATDHLEVHHFLIEWSEWEFADPVKLLGMAHHFDIYGFAAQLGDKPIESPDDIRNLMVLCATCHRGAGEGIHLVPAPNLFAQWLARDGITVLRPLKVKEGAPSPAPGPIPLGDDGVTA